MAVAGAVGSAALGIGSLHAARALKQAPLGGETPLFCLNLPCVRINLIVFNFLSCIGVTRKKVSIFILRKKWIPSLKAPPPEFAPFSVLESPSTLPAAAARASGELLRVDGEGGAAEAADEPHAAGALLPSRQT